MNRYLSLLLALLILLSGCGAKPDEADEDVTTGQDAETIARVMLAFLDENEEVDALSWYREPTEVDSYVRDYYKLENVTPLDGAVVRMEGARAFELSVLQVGETDVETVTAALQEYLQDRRGDFTGYLPDQAEMVDNALILTQGGWVALVVCQDPENRQEPARYGFENCFGSGVYARGIPAVLGPDPEDYRPDGRLIYRDPGVDDMTLFDNTAILSAWESGDDSGLSREDKAVLDKARGVFAECITPGMSDYDKEVALYSWLSQNTRYDMSHYEKSGAPRTSYEPYGPLIEGKGVCLGYAETFRLLMDMASIECITVTGASSMNSGNHAWNMVKLNGEWYCVDPTWEHIPPGPPDGPENPMQYANYFNVTSQRMADTDHQWDYDNTPEATAEDGGRPQP